MWQLKKQPVFLSKSGAKSWVEKDGIVKPEFQEDLDKVNSAGIPVDIVFKQGKDVLGI